MNCPILEHGVFWKEEEDNAGKAQLQDRTLRKNTKQTSIISAIKEPPLCQYRTASEWQVCFTSKFKWSDISYFIMLRTPRVWNDQKCWKQSIHMALRDPGDPGGLLKVSVRDFRLLDNRLMIFV
jgi:hypothetical protein